MSPISESINAVVAEALRKAREIAARTEAEWTESLGIGTPPTIFGPSAAAWTRQDVISPVAIAEWIIQAPLAHPIWPNYWLGVQHLRPHHRLPPATLFRPDATHEIAVYALDPGKPVSLISCPNVLHPANIIGQLHAQPDETAIPYTRALVRAVCLGALSPDTDCRAMWGQFLTLAPSKL